MHGYLLTLCLDNELPVRYHLVVISKHTLEQMVAGAIERVENRGWLDMGGIRG